ncbi:MAG: hypothetical protein QOI27_2184, partial [Gaiellaceae bacterium]|nr:hypothetical protein [Gaiellaceae bacterium]
MANWGRLRHAASGRGRISLAAVGLCLSAILLVAAPAASGAVPAPGGYPLISSSSGSGANANTTGYYVAVGDVLSVSSNGSWSGSPTFSYQWQHCDTTGATPCADIPGA